MEISNHLTVNTVTLFLQEKHITANDKLCVRSRNVPLQQSQRYLMLLFGEAESGKRHFLYKTHF